VDTLTRALSDSGGLPAEKSSSLRRTLAAAYEQLEDPNAFRQSVFIRHMSEIAVSLDLR
jgi:hypothetical protein